MQKFIILIIISFLIFFFSCGTNKNVRKAEELHKKGIEYYIEADLDMRP